MDRSTPNKSRSTSKASRSGSAVAASGVGPDLTGETFGDFHILRQLGFGGMGQVFLAEQISLKRKVAIKLLRDDLAGNPTALTRFKTESKTIAQLSHANIVQAYMIGKHEGRHFLVLEYVEGVSLREYMSRKGPLDVSFALSIMRQVASALHRASELNIIHRDIKPENILLTRKGEAKVADFGLSRCLSQEEPVDLTRPGSAVGTPRYMSPEQIEGKPVDYRSDIYSFGVTCYHMLAGQPPYEGNTGYEIAVKHVRGEPTPLESLRPELPAPLCELVHKMMAKKPHKRHPSARDLLKDIIRLKESLNNEVSSPAITMAAETVTDEPLAPRPSRTPLVLVLCAMALCMVGSVGAAAFWWYQHSRDPLPGPVAVAAPDKSEKNPDKTPGEKEKPAEKVVEKEKAVNLEPEEVLKRAVDRHLREFKSSPTGIEACIDLGTLYLKQQKLAEAETLFNRMDERRPPSSYHYLGRLGLALVDFAREDDRGTQAKLKDVFDTKKGNFHVKMINDYLKKNPEFESFVNDADEHNFRLAASGPGFTPFPNTKGGPSRWTPGKYPFRKPGGGN